MRRIEAALLVGVVCSVSLACSAGAPAADAQAARAAANTLIQRITSGDFEGAATLFHYPESYSAAELQKDRTEVAQGLALLVEEFGVPNDPRPADGIVVNLQAAVGGGTLPYWQSKRNLGRDVTLILEVKFEKEGHGFVPCYFYRSEDGLKIQAAGFALPVSRPDAAARIGSVMRRMVATVNGR